MVAFLREPEWVLFCQVMERPEIAEDPRFQGFPNRAQHRDILLPMLRAVFATRTAGEWAERFKAARMLCDLVNSPLDWLADPHVQAVGAAVPLAQPGLGTLPFPQLPGLGPWSVPAPALGEHTEDVLREIGL
jgi:formyl-CoA transferase